MSPTSSQLNAYYADQGSGAGVLKDGLGNIIGIGINMPTGAASGYVLASDASGNLTPQASPVLAATNTFTGVSTFNNSIQVPEGSYMGTVAVTGTSAVTVSTTAVTANSRVFVTTQVPSGTVGTTYVASTSVATYFTLKSSNAGDASTVAWLIINHT